MDAAASPRCRVSAGVCACTTPGSAAARQVTGKVRQVARSPNSLAAAAAAANDGLVALPRKGTNPVTTIDLNSMHLPECYCSALTDPALVL